MGDQCLPPFLLQERHSREGCLRLGIEGDRQVGHQLMEHIILRDTTRVLEEGKDSSQSPEGERLRFNLAPNPRLQLSRLVKRERDIPGGGDRFVEKAREVLINLGGIKEVTQVPKAIKSHQ